MTGGKVLVVDDDALLRSSVAAVLTDEGYDVELAGDGVDALAKIHAHRPDVILLDVLMPRMNGKALLETLHSSEETAGIPVLVMTALHGFESHRTVELGATDLVEKPFDVDELLNKVALAVYRSQKGREDPFGLAGGGEGGDLGEPTSRGVVLVVGDERHGPLRLDRMVSALGYTAVSLVHATHELPRLARLLEPRAIVLALGAGAAGRLEALRMVRAEPDLRDVPVLVLGRESDEAGTWRGEAEALGADLLSSAEAAGELSRLLGS